VNSVFTLPSFAKINWNLRILGKRPDGYHEVRTELQTISLHDDLSISPGDDQEIVLSCADPQIPDDRENLVVKAAEALRTAYAIKQGARIVLTKRIPVQAGLGGGSSNAAVALLGLSRLWSLQITPANLFRIASTIGSDVPFFLRGGRALATGTGTNVTELEDLPPKYLLIVSPTVFVATSEAYGLLSATALTSRTRESILAGFHEQAQTDDSHQLELTNDFEPVIFDREPEIKRARDALLRCGAQAALLAGSGSSVFGIFEDPTARTCALSEIEAEAGWRIYPCVTISRRKYSRDVNSVGDLRSV